MMNPSMDSYGVGTRNTTWGWAGIGTGTRSAATELVTVSNNHVPASNKRHDNTVRFRNEFLNTNTCGAHGHDITCACCGLT